MWLTSIRNAGCTHKTIKSYWRYRDDHKSNQTNTREDRSAQTLQADGSNRAASPRCPPHPSRIDFGGRWGDLRWPKKGRLFIIPFFEWKKSVRMTVMSKRNEKNTLFAYFEFGIKNHLNVTDGLIQWIPTERTKIIVLGPCRGGG